MANYIWEIVATRNNGKVTKGMSTKIMKSGTSAKPNQREIADALNKEYNADIHHSHCGSGNFNFTNLSR